MKTNKATAKALENNAFLSSLELSEEEKEACTNIFNKKLETLKEKREAYKKMIKDKSYTVKFGIRPEHCYVKGASLEKDVAPSEYKPFTVTISELLGNEYFLHGDFGGKDFVMKTTSYNPVKEGEKTEIVFDLNKIHIFDSIDNNIIC